jgi:hypothetical protein
VDKNFLSAFLNVFGLSMCVLMPCGRLFQFSISVYQESNPKSLAYQSIAYGLSNSGTIYTEFMLSLSLI